MTDIYNRCLTRDTHRASSKMRSCSCLIEPNKHMLEFTQRGKKTNGKRLKIDAERNRKIAGERLGRRLLSFSLYLSRCLVSSKRGKPLRCSRLVLVADWTSASKTILFFFQRSLSFFFFLLSAALFRHPLHNILSLQSSQEKEERGRESETEEKSMWVPETTAVKKSSRRRLRQKERIERTRRRVFSVWSCQV